MAAEMNRQWLLASRPQGMVKESNFQYNEAPIPELEDGQFLVHNCYIAFEPAMRGWMNDGASYMQPVQIGEVMRAVTTGQVIASKHPGYQPGDCVQGGFGWQEYIVTNGKGGLMPASKIPKEASITMPLGVLGITGLTAYFGLLDLGEPQEGQTCVVSGQPGQLGLLQGRLPRSKAAGWLVLQVERRSALGLQMMRTLMQRLIISLKTLPLGCVSCVQMASISSLIMLVVKFWMPLSPRLQ